MSVSRAMRRLLHIRNLEEEQSRLALESAMGEFNRLECELTVAIARERQGRRLVEASAQTGELPDRLAGLEETRSATRHAEALEPRIEAKENEVAELRQAFLVKRVEHRQAETLIQETEAQDAVEADRRAQQSLDGWFGARMHRKGNESESSEAPHANAARRPDAEQEDCSGSKKHEAKSA
jgi:hypothetical protein